MAWATEDYVFRRPDLGAGARSLRLINALTGHPAGRTLADLAAELGVSESTIKRDLGQFHDAGISIERMLIDGRAAARLTDERHRSLVPITRRERYTLLAMRRMFDVFAGTPLAEDIRSLLEKLAPAATTEERDEIAADRDRFAYVPEGGTKHYRGKEDILDALQTGILKRRILEYGYKAGRGGAKRGYLAPIAMVVFKQGLYVIGRTLAEPTARMSAEDDIFAIERFTSAEPLRRTSFEVPIDFRLDDKLVSSFELPVGDPKHAKRVVIEFSKERASYVRAREWHKHQTLHEQPDGSVLLSFTCINLLPVVSWVHQWDRMRSCSNPPSWSRSSSAKPPRRTRATRHVDDGGRMREWIAHAELPRSARSRLPKVRSTRHRPSTPPNRPLYLMSGSRA